MSASQHTISSAAYYSNYYGHRLGHLAAVYARVAQDRPTVWLAGDSSLDNKYWVLKKPEAAVNGYERVLSPPLSRCDVCHFMNKMLGPEVAVVNTAVEGSLLRSRGNKLLPQDIFLRDHVRPEDTIIVSVGGNDIALCPSFTTILNLLKASLLNSEVSIRSNPGKAWGMNHFTKLFGKETKQYVEKLVAQTLPRRVIVCMIYFPDMRTSSSWATWALRFLKYDSQPGLLQSMIEAVYNLATEKIHISGTEVVAVPLFQAMNGKDTTMYVDRVEPSSKGSEAIAKLLSSHCT